MEAEPKDVGDQALIRGLATAFPIVRPGLFPSYCGRRQSPATKRVTDIPHAVVPPPPMREVNWADQAWAAVAALATAHMKPASSRAIAVQTTVVFLPRAINVR